MRLRAEYSVGPHLKFLANLDMMHLMERTLRRAKIPYLLSEGFNPHIKMSLGTILPVGVWGQKEYFDLDIKPMPIADFIEAMNQALPPGIYIRKCCEILPLAPALMKVINAADYIFMMQCTGLDLENIAAQILSQDKILVNSKGKNKMLTKDLRPGLYDINAERQDEVEIIMARVSVNEPLNIRFDEILDVFVQYGINKKYMLDFWRRGNYIRKGEHYYSPLEKV
ncbi:MAG: TIGR03936 family radical SAM-associated protein [Syntrophomonas sp.]|nr:TIGR03936 family radical SAM-associated protein [Syntrophomonas sp.]